MRCPGMLDHMDSSADFEYEVAPEHACLLPYIGSCSGPEPTFRSDGLCTHYSPSCQQAEPTENTCDSVPSGEDVRLCPCYSAEEGDPASSYVLGDDEGEFHAAIDTGKLWNTSKL